MNRLPFSDKDSKDMLRAQLSRDYQMSKSLSAGCKDLIGQHLNPNPSTRANMNDIFQHDWFGEDKTNEEDDE